MAYERKNPIPDQHQEILNAIGKKILELRKATNLSLERFCAKNDIPRISYSNLEAGKNFHMTTLLKVMGTHPEVKSLENFFKGLWRNFMMFMYYDWPFNSEKLKISWTFFLREPRFDFLSVPFFRIVVIDSGN